MLYFLKFYSIIYFIFIFVFDFLFHILSKLLFIFQSHKITYLLSFSKVVFHSEVSNSADSFYHFSPCL